MGWTPPRLSVSKYQPVSCGVGHRRNPKESDMNAIADVQVSVSPVAANAGDVIGVDLAKNVFQLCIADSAWRVLETRRLTRRQFESFFLDRAVALVVME